MRGRTRRVAATCWRRAGAVRALGWAASFSVSRTLTLSDGGATKVLIADDSAIVGMRLADLLYEVEGIHVVVKAEDAPQALELVRTLNPDAVIVDVRMRDGTEHT